MIIKRLNNGKARLYIMESGATLVCLTALSTARKESFCLPYWRGGVSMTRANAAGILRSARGPRT